MAERPLSAGPFHWLGLLAVAVAALAADQLTKQIVATQLELGESVHVVGPLYIRHVDNPGIAFGLFSSWASAVTFLTAAAVVWMLFYFAKSGARHPILPVALGLLIGGSLGNLVDRLRIGHVTDFLDLRFWPAFNLADTFIVVGVAALLLALISAERQPRIRRTASNRPAPKTLA
jgi:signal peptidase II